MKRCPHCGADLLDGTASFCPDCQKGIPEQDSARRKRRKRPETAGKRSHRGRKDREATPIRQDENYDGYYDDVLPPDLDQYQEGVDRELVKRVILLTLGVSVIIFLCAAFLYVV